MAYAPTPRTYVRTRPSAWQSSACHQRRGLSIEKGRAVGMSMRVLFPPFLPPSIPPSHPPTRRLALTALHVLGPHGTIALLRLLCPHAPLLKVKKLTSTIVRAWIEIMSWKGHDDRGRGASPPSSPHSTFAKNVPGLAPSARGMRRGAGAGSRGGGRVDAWCLVVWCALCIVCRAVACGEDDA